MNFGISEPPGQKGCRRLLAAHALRAIIAPALGLVMLIALRSSRRRALRTLERSDSSIQMHAFTICSADRLGQALRTSRLHNSLLGDASCFNPAAVLGFLPRAIQLLAPHEYSMRVRSGQPQQLDGFREYLVLHVWKGVGSNCARFFRGLTAYPASGISVFASAIGSLARRECRQQHRTALDVMQPDRAVQFSVSSGSTPASSQAAIDSAASINNLSVAFFAVMSG